MNPSPGNAAVFDLYSQYYDLLYADKDYHKETDYVCGALARLGVSGGRLIEFGSGTGKHAACLCERGFEVLGIERSEEMARIAVLRRQQGFRSLVADIRSVRVDEKFDAVISLFHVISYLTTNDDLQQAFDSARAHLDVGGVFLFDVWHGPAVLTQRPSVRVRRMQDGKINVLRIAQPDINLQENLVRVHYTVFVREQGQEQWISLEESHPMRYLFPTEIAFLAQNSGFSLELCEAFETGQPASEQSWGVAYGLRKTS